jgi:uncharacterized damage-inducible protein DinB
VTTTIHRILEIPSGYRSPTVARYVWQLDDQTRRLLEATRDLTPQALEWQMAPGVNTMGMLFAHIAVAEAHMTAVLLEGRPTSDLKAVLGIVEDDDGLPLPPEGRPPAALAGKGMDFFTDLLRRAREETHRVARTLGEADLDRRIVRQPGDGSTRHYNVDWSLYHLVEHLAGHHGQILQLKHLVQRRPGA